METEITRNEDHFVRNHGGIPTIKEEDYYFDVTGLVNNPRRITLKELQDQSIFPRQSNIVTIQCSGTRRIEQIQQYPGDGDEVSFLEEHLSWNTNTIQAYQRTMGRGCNWHSSLDWSVS